jgi:hypothetical protein
MADAALRAEADTTVAGGERALTDFSDLLRPG